MSEQNEINEQTLNILSDNIFYAGFGAIGRDEVAKALEKGNDEFQLIHDTKINGDSVRGVLHFKRSEQDLDKVFFNSFDLLIKKEGKEQTLQQKFPVYFGNKYTLKEGYNLLDGRSVFKKFTSVDPDNKDIKKTHEAWVNLDFKNTDERGHFQIAKVFNYDLDKKLAEYPIKGLEYSQNKNRLLESLRKGDRVQVIMETNRGEEKIKIEAAPRFGSVNLFDENMKPIRLSIKKPELEQSTEQAKQQSAENGITQPTSETKIDKGQNEKKDNTLSKGQKPEQQTKQENKGQKNKVNNPAPKNAQKRGGLRA